MDPLRDRIPEEFAIFVTPEGKIIELSFIDFIIAYEKAVAREKKQSFDTAMARARVELMKEFGSI